MQKRFVFASILASAALVVPLAAQTSGTVDSTSTTTTTTTTTSAGEVVSPGRSDRAMNGWTSSLYLQPYVGYIRYGNLYSYGNGATGSNKNGALYGAQLGVSFTPMWSILGNVAYNRSQVTARYYDSGTPSTTGSYAQQSLSSDEGVLFFDGDLQFRYPLGVGASGSAGTWGSGGSWIAPLVQAGVGGVRYSPSGTDFHAAGSYNNVAFNAGVGLDFQVVQAFGIRLMAKDYISNTNWKSLSNVNSNLNPQNTTAHNWAFTAGLNFGF